jgi:YHS domain-containing protein
MEKDPVCGMDVDPATTQHKSEHQGKTYYFCAPGCRRSFDSDPRKYLDPSYKPSMYRATSHPCNRDVAGTPPASVGRSAARRSR